MFGLVRNTRAHEASNTEIDDRIRSGVSARLTETGRSTSLTVIVSSAVCGFDAFAGLNTLCSTSSRSAARHTPRSRRPCPVLPVPFAPKTMFKPGRSCSVWSSARQLTFRTLPRLRSSTRPCSSASAGRSASSSNPGAGAFAVPVRIARTSALSSSVSGPFAKRRSRSRCQSGSVFDQSWIRFWRNSGAVIVAGLSIV